jgi:hypothetical protein
MRLGDRAVIGGFRFETAYACARPCGRRGFCRSGLGQHARHCEEERVPALRRQRGAAGVLQPRRQGQLDGPRRRLLPCGGRRHLQRSEQGAVCAGVLRRAVHRAPGWAVRYPIAQHDLDHGPRRGAGAGVHRHRFLRRPGLHGAQVVRHHECAAAEGRHALHPDRHDQRAERGGLFARAQPWLQGHRLPEGVGVHRGL